MLIYQPSKKRSPTECKFVPRAKATSILSSTSSTISFQILYVRLSSDPKCAIIVFAYRASLSKKQIFPSSFSLLYSSLFGWNWEKYFRILSVRNKGVKQASSLDLLGVFLPGQTGSLPNVKQSLHATTVTSSLEDGLDTLKPNWSLWLRLKTMGRCWCCSSY